LILGLNAQKQGKAVVFLRYILYFCLLFAFAIPIARAETLIPMPVLSQGFDLTAYAAGTDTITKTIEGNHSIGFELSLPKTWIERTTLDQTYGELVRYEGPAYGDVLPFLSVHRLPMKRENTAKLELISYILKQNYVLRALNVTSDRAVEAVYVMVNKAGDSFVVRAKAKINGADFLLAEYGVPARAFEEQRDAQTFAMGSFKFLNDTNTAIENRVERTYFKALRFYYPASWVFVGEETPSDNRVSIKFSSKAESGFETGRIKLTLVSNASLKDTKNKNAFAVDVPGLLKETRKSFEDTGYLFGQKIESKKPDLNIKTNFAVQDAYDLHLKTSEYESQKMGAVTHELWLAVFNVVGADGEQKIYVAELFTPARAQDLYLWSVNTRAFEIILKSIQ
jgi:hypothetical protein